jgi:hypothetical protein
MAISGQQSTRCTGVEDVGRLVVGNERIALIGVEGEGPCAAAGRDLVRKLALGREVRVERDTQARDAEGRTLAYVFLPDGTLLNGRVIREGFARVGTMGPNLRHAGELVAAQTAARTRRLCVWTGEHKQPGSPEVKRGLVLPGGGGGGPRPILPPPKLPPLPNPKGPR